MTVAERMRRMGWTRRGSQYVATFYGVDCLVDHWLHGGEMLSRAFACHPAMPNCEVRRYIVGDMRAEGGVVGLTSLAQRAKAAARRLARQRGK